MKPAPFDHAAATSIEHAVSLLAAHDDAVVLAGGQSLVPLLALRHTRPALVVDINPLDLAHIELVNSPPNPPDTTGDTEVAAPSTGTATHGSADGGNGDRPAPTLPDESSPGGYGGRRTGTGELRLGALVRQRTLERDPLVRAVAPLMAEAAGWIGSPAIRHRGTLGGSLAHAEPAAELPAVLVTLGGSVVVQGPRGRRTIAAPELFRGPHSTALDYDELLVEVRIPMTGAGQGAAFCEWAPRHGDLPDAGVAVTVERGPDGHCTSIGAAACGVATTPLDLAPALAPAARGESEPTDGLLREVASRVRATILAASPGDADTADRHRSRHQMGRTERRDRAELAGLLSARAVHRAFARSVRPHGQAPAA